MADVQGRWYCARYYWMQRRQSCCQFYGTLDLIRSDARCSARYVVALQNITFFFAEADLSVKMLITFTVFLWLLEKVTSWTIVEEILCCFVTLTNVIRRDGRVEVTSKNFEHYILIKFKVGKGGPQQRSWTGLWKVEDKIRPMRGILSERSAIEGSRSNTWFRFCFRRNDVWDLRYRFDFLIEKSEITNLPNREEQRGFKWSYLTYINEWFWQP